MAKVVCETCCAIGVMKDDTACPTCKGTGWNERALSPPPGYAVLPLRLTAENGAKGLMIGEFFTKMRVTCATCGGDGNHPELDDESCQDCAGEGWNVGRAEVDWTTIKSIWERAADYFAEQVPG